MSQKNISKNKSTTGNVIRLALGNLRFALAVFLLGSAIVLGTLSSNYLVKSTLVGVIFMLFTLSFLIIMAFTLLRPKRQVFIGGFICVLLFILLYTGISFSQSSAVVESWIILPSGLAEIADLIMIVFSLILSLRLAVTWKGDQKRTLRRILLTTIPLFIIMLSLSGLGTVSAINSFPHEVNMSAPVPNGQQAISVTTLLEQPGNQPIKQVTLVAEQKVINGKTMWTYNGIIPGPQIRVTQGDRLKVTLINHLPVATSIHWHGIRLPNAEDGVAGITQDAIKPGQTYTYEFVVKDAGSYMYHSHQDTFNQMLKGLFGALIVEPKKGQQTDKDFTVLFHESPGDNSIGPGMKGYFNLRNKEAPAFNGQTDETHFDAKPGETVRLRLMGAIQGEAGKGEAYMIAPAREFILTGAPYTVQAIDGNDINQPQQLGPQRIPVGIGQRYDLVFTMPYTNQVRLSDTEGDEIVTIGNGSPPSTSNKHIPLFDIMQYGEKTTDSVLEAKSGKFDVSYPMILQFKGGLREDKLELLQTINSQYSPMMAQYMVKEGQLVHFHIVNKTIEFHTIHLHGHYFTVLSHNGKQVQGSPIHIDSLLVPPNDSFDIAFLADNPGLWMVHCHVLVHAAFGMSAMVLYEGYTTPYSIGALSGNKPE